MRGRHEAEGCGLRDLEQRKLGVSFLLEGRVNTVLTIEAGEKRPPCMRGACPPWLPSCRTIADLISFHFFSFLDSKKIIHGEKPKGGNHEE